MGEGGGGGDRERKLIQPEGSVIPKSGSSIKQIRFYGRCVVVESMFIRGGRTTPLVICVTKTEGKRWEGERRDKGEGGGAGEKVSYLKVLSHCRLDKQTTQSGWCYYCVYGHDSCTNNFTGCEAIQCTGPLIRPKWSPTLLSQTPRGYSVY